MNLPRFLRPDGTVSPSDDDDRTPTVPVHRLPTARLPAEATAAAHEIQPLLAAVDVCYRQLSMLAPEHQQRALQWLGELVAAQRR